MSDNNTDSILIVDDEEHILFSSKSLLHFSGFKNVITTDDSRKVLTLLKKEKVSVVVLDLFMPYITGNVLLTSLNRDYPHIPVIVMTASDETETAVECMKAGAFDYLVKPVEKTRFISSVKRAMELCGLKDQVSRLREGLFSDRIEHMEAFSSIVTASPKMRAVFKYCEAVAVSNQPVIITGETGTGKELIAKAIHTLSGLRGKFVAVNAAGLDDNMFSDALFGHKKGAYTGAEQPRAGLIAQAASGTLFLDEIGDLREISQIKLLRLLQEQEYYQVGSDIPLVSDARIIVATNRNLKELTASGSFRNDLYFRLCTHQIHLPPLRNRQEDIRVLLEYFLADSAQTLNKKIPSYPPELLLLLSQYDFPGNVREMKSIVFDAVARHKSGILSMECFKSFIGSAPSEFSSDPALAQAVVENQRLALKRFPTLREIEEFMIAEAMKIADNNQGIAASMLGFTRQTLNKRLRKSKGKTS